MSESKNESKLTVVFQKRPPWGGPSWKRQMIISAESERASAMRELKRRLHDDFMKEIALRSGGKMLYRELLPRYYQSLKDRDLALATIENHSLCLNSHTIKLWGHRTIDSILPDEVRQLIKVKLADRSKSHQKNMLKYLRGVFNFASEAGHLQKSPVPFMQFRHERKLKRVLNESEMNFFLQKAFQYEHEWRYHWIFAVMTGMRNEEQYALRWHNVDIDNRKIYVREVWTKKDGFKCITKNGEDRLVEIAPPLVTALKELKLKNDDSVFVLPRIDAWDAGRQAEMLRTFLVGINLQPMSYHALRATWATLMLSKGVEPVKVMKAGGWSSLKTLEKHYLRLSGVDIQGMTDKITLHDLSAPAGTLLEMPSRSNL